MTKIAFLTNVVSPFQVELAESMNWIGGINYKVFFCCKQSARPAHWLDVGEMAKDVAVTIPPEVKEPSVQDWLFAQVSAFAPDVILIGGIKGDWYDLAKRYRKRCDQKVLLGLWLEPPLENPNPLHRLVRRLFYRYQHRSADFVLAIGDRSHAYNRRYNPNIHFVPYGEDLSVCLEAPLRRPPRSKLRFLFSGGLVERHNFQLIMQALQSLLERRGACFEFVISGHGPEQSVIDDAIAKTPLMKEVIIYDRDFQCWSDRLRPFIEADVFVYPSRHSGWGLVIPEAMAAGMVVISGKGVEASRYFIDHNENGLFTDLTRDALVSALERCLDNPDWVRETGKRARQSALRGHAPNVASRLVESTKIATLLAKDTRNSL